jgi:flavin reductase (DIM6/NTAB) family NADH-FMN oxidoreductase RutF
MNISLAEIEKMPSVNRLKLINGLSGIRQASLIGTKSTEGITNLAIFNSITHIGSSPAYLGFILRPQENKSGGTYENILATGNYTINHVHQSFIEKAHYTSTKFDEAVSEFERCKLTEAYLPEFNAPFVAESLVKIGLSHQESIPIKVNDTILVIGKIEHIWLGDNALDANGYLDLETLNSIGIVGLNSYYSLKKEVDYPYARAHEAPDFE